ASHEKSKGEKGCVAGQGELKKVRIDPLFAINHTLAMLRANINRLVRKTWCTTKKPERLLDHLAIYTWFHNTKLIQPALLAA
ncbi:MAG: transposase, partial [bacterium]|nr:transposase [bacterium]